MRKFLAGGFCCNNVKLNGQNIVVTGSNSGIGKETARELVKRGANVILACRNTKAGEIVAKELKESLSGSVLVEELDLSSYGSIRDFAKRITKQYSKIHCLVNNAAVLCSPSLYTKHGQETHMGVNYLGPFLLTKLLLPLLKKGHPAKIVNVSSNFQSFGWIPFDDFQYKRKIFNKFQIYANSKLALILHARQLARNLQGTNVEVFSLHPGVVQSNVGRHFPFGFSFMSSKVLSYFSKTTKEGAQTTIYCVTEAKQESPYFYSDCSPCQPNKIAMDDKNAEKLWEMSERFVSD